MFVVYLCVASLPLPVTQHVRSDTKTQAQRVQDVLISEGFYSQQTWNALGGKKNVPKMAGAYLHALKLGSSGSHVRRGRGRGRRLEQH